MTASAKQNSDLFWGIRGAAQNLGIVTSLTMKAYPVGLAYRGTYVRQSNRNCFRLDPFHPSLQLYPMDQIDEVLRGVNNFMQTAPREFNCEIYNRGREEGSWDMYLKVCYSFYMSEQEAESMADPLRAIGAPVEVSWDWITHVQV